jgi:hypothetical protein
MKTGQKSLLFGVHQFIWHPIIVWLAWWSLYGWPTWKETVCIIVHDWGYWFCEHMDDEKGKEHPVFGAILAYRLFGLAYQNLVLTHSRHYARLYKFDPSRLCWADKLSILYEPWWWYLPRAWLSGELMEYRQTAAAAGFIPLEASHRTWFKWVKGYLVKQGIEQQARVFVNPARYES